MNEPSMAGTSSFPVHQLLIRCLGLLRTLADSLEEAESALAATSYERLLQNTARHRELCCEVRVLALACQEETRISSHAGLAEDLHAAARRVGELNRKYSALLRHRRRTVDIFCRVLANSGTTYPAPKALRSAPEGKRTRG